VIGKASTSENCGLNRHTVWCTSPHSRGLITVLHLCRVVLSRERNVCLSVCHMCELWKTKETCAHILIPHERTFILVFQHKELLVGTTPHTWNFEPNWPRSSKNADFQSIFARSASAITPSESSVITNRKSTMCFPVISWTSYVAPQPPKGGGSKMQNSYFLSEIALHLKKVYYKVSVCQYCQWHSCKAFTGLSVRAKMVRWGTPFCMKIWLKSTLLKMLISNQ